MINRFLMVFLLFAAVSLAAAEVVSLSDTLVDSSYSPSFDLSPEPLCRAFPERCLMPWPYAPAGWNRLTRFPGGKIRVDTLVVVARDAFDDSEVKSEADRAVLSFANHLHWETRETVVRRSLPFEQGTLLSADELLEGERLLRQQKFFNDAVVELWSHPDGRHMVRVVTSDRFTLSLPLSLSRPDDQWLFSIGLLEYNLLGSGNQLGALLAKTEERDIFLGFFQMPHFLLYDQRLELKASRNSDGYQGIFSLYRPFTRSDTRWAWTLEGMMMEFDDRWMADRRSAFVFDSLYAPIDLIGREAWLLSRNYSLSLAELRTIRADSLSARISYAVGDDHFKSYMRFGWDRWNYTAPAQVDTLLLALPITNGIGEADTLVGTGAVPSEWWHRRDSRIGVRHTLRSFRYQTVRNLRNVRWLEDLELGWTLYNGISRNFKALGAEREEWRLEHGFRLQEAWQSRLFITFDAATHYYLGSSLLDGWFGAKSEFAYKQSGGHFSTHLRGALETYYADKGLRQLRLGASTGMEGFPTDWMVGRSTLAASIEERWIPGVEFGTVVPVVAAFARTGGAWSALDQIRPGEMETSIGIGLRLGMSKSVQGVVNYIDLSWPLNGALADGLSGWRFSIFAHTSL